MGGRGQCARWMAHKEQSRGMGDQGEQCGWGGWMDMKSEREWWKEQVTEGPTSHCQVFHVRPREMEVISGQEK